MKNSLLFLNYGKTIKAKPSLSTKNYEKTSKIHIIYQGYTKLPWQLDTNRLIIILNNYVIWLQFYDKSPRMRQVVWKHFDRAEDLCYNTYDL